MTALGDSNAEEVSEFWHQFLLENGLELGTPQPTMSPFGDSVELANELLDLVLTGRKRATASLVAEYGAESEPLPRVGDYWIVADGSMRPRAVLQTTEIRIGPLSSVDDDFAFDEGEGDRSRTFWLDAHTTFFTRLSDHLGLEFSADAATVFERFALIHTAT